MVERTIVADRGVEFRDDNIDTIATLAIRKKTSREYPELGVDAFETCVIRLGLDANDAHAAYANCSDILVIAKPFTGNGIVNTLARFVCRDLNSPNNPELHRQVIWSFAQFSPALDLRKIVAAL